MIPPSANYRKAKSKRSCGNCRFYLIGWCRMFRSPVRRDYVCKHWAKR